MEKELGFSKIEREYVLYVLNSPHSSSLVCKNNNLILYNQGDELIIDLARFFPQGVPDGVYYDTDGIIKRQDKSYLVVHDANFLVAYFPPRHNGHHIAAFIASWRPHAKIFILSQKLKEERMRRNLAQ